MPVGWEQRGAESVTRASGHCLIALAGPAVHPCCRECWEGFRGPSNPGGVGVLVAPASPGFFPTFPAVGGAVSKPHWLQSQEVKRGECD